MVSSNPIRRPRNNQRQLIAARDGDIYFLNIAKAQDAALIQHGPIGKDLEYDRASKTHLIVNTDIGGKGAAVSTEVISDGRFGMNPKPLCVRYSGNLHGAAISCSGFAIATVLL